MSLRSLAADQLRTAIKGSGRSQADVARAAGVSQKHLCQMLAGRCGTFDAFDRIAAELDMAFVVVAGPRHSEAS